MTYLDSHEDLQWLSEVHKIPVENVVLAILEGNEDCPTRIYTYPENHYQAIPLCYQPDEELNYQRVEGAI